MALWSMFVEVGVERYSAQFTAEDPAAAVDKLLASSGFRQMSAKLSSADEPSLQFTAEDIIYIVPMEDLVNMHLCQIGRRGKYASVVMARTEGSTHV